MDFSDSESVSSPDPEDSLLEVISCLKILAFFICLIFQRKTHKVLYRYFKVLHCSWDRTWSPPALDPCAATACQQIPFPPKETGLVHLEDPDNPITLASEFTLYDVSLPLKMKFPGDFCGDEGRIMLVVGSIPSGGKNPLEIIFQGEGPKEAFHVLVDPGDKKNKS